MSSSVPSIRKIIPAGFLALFLALLATSAQSAPACPPGDAPYPPFYSDGGFFTRAFAKVDAIPASTVRLTGITVPHHLLADHLVALGFKAASGFRYRRIVLLTPDHFRKLTKPFGTTGRSFDEVLGPVATDRRGAAKLLEAGGLVEDSCLFDRDHGIRALLPFLHHHFPGAEVLPVAISVKSVRADWDAISARLLPLLDDDALVVESTDFSHYLPHYQARQHDQETLNVLAGGSLDQIAALLQPGHADSVGALYIQTKLQRERYGAPPVAIANENGQEYDPKPLASTTSYIVLVFGPPGTDWQSQVGLSADVTFLAGDVNFGRAMKDALLDDAASARVRAEILKRTGGRPLVVNLEGVILPNVPSTLDHLTLAMPEELAIPFLKSINVVAVSLANNHSMDLGPSGLAETKAALDRAGIASFGQGEALTLRGMKLVGLSDIDSNATLQTRLVTPALLDRLVTPDPALPVLAFIHWGREYVASAAAREDELTDAMRAQGVTGIVGGHPHVASGHIEALAGGSLFRAYSLGNFLFDQTAAHSSGALIEITVFRQGTIFARQLELPNLFDLARKSAQP